MTTTSTENRNAAYLSIIEKLPQKKQLIFQLIKENEPCTACQVSDKYMIPINEVVARITDLKNDFLLIEAGSATNKYTSKANTLYKTVKTTEQRINIVNKAFVVLRDARDKYVNDYRLGLSSLTKSFVKKKLNKINKQIKLLEEVRGLNEAV